MGLVRRSCGYQNVELNLSLGQAAWLYLKPNILREYIFGRGFRAVLQSVFLRPFSFYIKLNRCTQKYEKIIFMQFQKLSNFEWLKEILSQKSKKRFLSFSQSLQTERYVNDLVLKCRIFHNFEGCIFAHFENRKLYSVCS